MDHWTSVLTTLEISEHLCGHKVWRWVRLCHNFVKSLSGRVFVFVKSISHIQQYINSTYFMFAVRNHKKDINIGPYGEAQCSYCEHVLHLLSLSLHFFAYLHETTEDTYFHCWYKAALHFIKQKQRIINPLRIELEIVQGLVCQPPCLFVQGRPLSVITNEKRERWDEKGRRFSKCVDKESQT